MIALNDIFVVRILAAEHIPNVDRIPEAVCIPATETAQLTRRNQQERSRNTAGTRQERGKERSRGAAGAPGGLKRALGRNNNHQNFFVINGCDRLALQNRCRNAEGAQQDRSRSARRAQASAWEQ